VRCHPFSDSPRDCAKRFAACCRSLRLCLRTVLYLHSAPQQAPSRDLPLRGRFLVACEGVNVSIERDVLACQVGCWIAVVKKLLCRHMDAGSQALGPGAAAPSVGECSRAAVPASSFGRFLPQEGGSSYFYILCWHGAVLHHAKCSHSPYPVHIFSQQSSVRLRHTPCPQRVARPPQIQSSYAQIRKTKFVHGPSNSDIVICMAAVQPSHTLGD